MSVPTCACTVVYYQPIDNGDGSLTERWHCSMCGRLFVKAVVIEGLVQERDRLRGQLAGMREAGDAIVAALDALRGSDLDDVTAKTVQLKRELARYRALTAQEKPR